MSWARRLSALLVGVCTTGSASAQNGADAAESPRFRLEWIAPSECPAGAEVVRRAETIVGNDEEAPKPVSAQGVVVHDEVEGIYRLTFTLTDDSSGRRREVEAATCEELGQAAALVLAIALDPEAQGELLATDSAPSPSSDDDKEQPRKEQLRKKQPRPVAVAPSPSPAQQSTEKQAPEREPTRWSAAVGMGAGVSAGVVGQPAVGVHAWEGITFGRGEVWLRQYYVPSSNVSSDTSSSAGAELSVIGMSTHLCLRVWSRNQVSLVPCTGLDVAALRGAGYGVVNHLEAVRHWAAWEVGGRLRLRLPHQMAAVIGGEGFVALSRPRFLLDRTTLYRPAPLGGTTFLGLEWWFL